jgi:RHS repeat-associated protein
MRVSTESGQTRYYDAETELHYNRFRYYDPSIGRYISADPIGQIGGINTFLYARNEPLNSIDPLGLGPGDWTPGSAARDAYSRARDAIESVPDPRKAARDAAAKALGEIGGGNPLLIQDPDDTLGKLEDAGDAVGELCPIAEGVAAHMFDGREGHVPDTPENRRLLREVASDPANTRGVDEWGNEWSSKILDDGRQVWTQKRDGEIQNGGINDTPRDWNPRSGFSAPTRPGK